MIHFFMHLHYALFSYLLKHFHIRLNLYSMICFFGLPVNSTAENSTSVYYTIGKFYHANFLGLGLKLRSGVQVFSGKGSNKG